MRARHPVAQLALPGLVALEHVVGQAGAAGLGQERGAEPDQAAGGDQVVEADPAGAVVDHLGQLAPAGTHHLGDGADVLLGDVDGQALDGLVEDPVDLPGHHLGLAHGQLEALAAHDLDQHGQGQLAPALDLPGVGALGVQHPQRHVADQLGVEAVLEQAGGDLAALLAGQRRGVGADGDRQAGLVDGQDGQRVGVLEVAEGLADGHLGQAGQSDQLAGARLVDGHPIELLGHVELGDLGGGERAVPLAPGHGLALADRPPVDPAQSQATDVGIGVEVGHVGLQRALGVGGRRRDGVEQDLEQRLEVDTGRVDVEGRPAVAGRGVDDGELQLVVVGVEVDEQVQDLVGDVGRAGVGAVHLVDHEDHRQPEGQRLAQHEAGLGEGALGGVDEEDHAVDHGQRPLDLAAEVGVARGVDDVELGAAPLDRRVLGEDGDALLALEVHRVHDPIVDLLVGPEGAGLPEHGVDQGGLPVVDVGDDGGIAQGARGHGGDSLAGLCPPGGRRTPSGYRRVTPAGRSRSPCSCAPSWVRRAAPSRTPRTSTGPCR